jgi:hypothetical protein
VGFVEEVLIQLFAVNREIARAWTKNHTRRRCFPSARAQVLN